MSQPRITLRRTGAGASIVHGLSHAGITSRFPDGRGVRLQTESWRPASAGPNSGGALLERGLGGIDDRLNLTDDERLEPDMQTGQRHTMLRAQELEVLQP